MDLMATLATAPLRAQNDKPAAGSRNRGEDTATGLSFPSLLENRQTVAEGTRSHRSETTRPTDEQRSATDDRAERDVPVAAADGTKDSVATEQRRRTSRMARPLTQQARTESPCLRVFRIRGLC